jgi:phage I-like protein
MGKSFGWWVDLAKVTLNEADATTWVHALPFGEYKHPIYGDMVFDASKLGALATSVKSKTRGVDPDIDYDHKTDPAKGNQAAGWVKDADVRGDGLYLQVTFTPTAAGELKEKKYRYFSADFTDEWTDALGVTHKDVLMGGGLTNRPYMKNLMPVNLSDLLLGEPKDAPEAEVDIAKLRGLLGLAPEADEAAVTSKLAETVASVTKLTDDNKKLTDEIAVLKTPDPQVDPQLRQLVEASPAFKKLMEDLAAKEQKLNEQQTAIRLAEVKGQLDSLQRGKTFALAPSAREELEGLMLKADPAASKMLYDFLEKVTTGAALVDLSEKGYTGRRVGDDVDATRRFNEMVTQLVEKEKMDYGSAVERIAKENPTLFQEYREATYSFKA